MRNDKIRRFRPRSNKFRSRRPNNGMVNNGAIHNGIGIKNNLHRNHIHKNPQNLERVIEKYKNLAKEALSAGDKILHENYLQHSDHFSRILSELGPEKIKTNPDNTNSENTQKQNILNEQN